jgi:hypothetical protein
MRLRVRSPDPDGVISTLVAVTGVTGVQYAKGPPMHAARYLVDVDAPDAVAALAPALVAAGHVLLEMTADTVELESLFLTLTEQTNP